ncbi:MAG: hypothetical protein RJA19_1149 [Bacteroidota bacterium]|jgi:hypothetical protein
MRNAILVAAFAAFSSGLASAQYYNTSAFTAPYVELEEPNFLDFGAGWDDPEATIPLGFDCPLFGSPTNQVMVSGVGEMLMIPSLDGSMDVIWPLSLDVCDVSQVVPGQVSRINYLTTGTAPNRICKIEWNNVGFYAEVYGPGTGNQRGNWQAWLYEADGSIEFRFGPNTITDLIEVVDGGLFSSGLFENFDYYNYMGQFQIGDGDPAVGNFNFYTDINSFIYTGVGWTSMPANGQVYRFGETASSVAQADAPEVIRMFPNPTRDVLNLQIPASAGEDRYVRALDAQGREVYAAQLFPGATAQWEVGNWPAGFYLITDGQGTVERIQVQ